MDPTLSDDFTGYEFVIALFDSSFFAAVFPILGVALGAWLTHKFTLPNKIKEDNRERLLGAVMEALQASNELLTNFREYAYNAPRGGGRIRTADDVNAEWEEIDEETAHEHDLAAADAIERMMINSDRLGDLTVSLEVFAPQELTESFQALPNRVTELFAALMEEEMHRGRLAEEALNDMSELYENALVKTRRLAKVSE